MKCIIIAAGYATRLYPLTENFPKPLLEVGGKSILDWLIEDLEKTGRIDEYIVVTNHKFAHHFQQWADAKKHSPLSGEVASGPLITILDDGTSTNETRLGAVRDIQLAISGGNQMVKNRSLPFEQDDSRLRILYLYQMLKKHTDESHALSTGQIMEALILLNV